MEWNFSGDLPSFSPEEIKNLHIRLQAAMREALFVFYNKIGLYVETGEQTLPEGLDSLLSTWMTEAIISMHDLEKDQISIARLELAIRSVYGLENILRRINGNWGDEPGLGDIGPVLPILN